MKAWTKALITVLITPFLLAGVCVVFCLAGYSLAAELMSDLADWAGE